MEALPPAPPPPIPSDNLGRGPVIMAVGWTLTALCVFVISLRFYVRRTMAGFLSSDDWFMLAATVFQVAFQILATLAFDAGLGRHDENLSYEDLMRILKWNWISTTPALCVAITGRISAAVLLIRIFGSKAWLRWFLIVFTAIQSLTAVVLIAMVYTSATPVEALWDPLDMDAERWDPRIQTYTVYFAQALFTVSDLTYVLFPVGIIFKLNMPVRRKIGLAIMMSMSLVTAGASIMKAITSQGYGPEDKEPQYIASLAILWSEIEQSFIIIMGCIPPLRSFAITRVSWLRNLSTHAGSAERSLRSGTGRYTRSSLRASGPQQAGNYVSYQQRRGHKPSSTEEMALFAQSSSETTVTSPQKTHPSRPKTAYDVEKGEEEAKELAGRTGTSPFSHHGSFYVEEPRDASQDSTRRILRRDDFVITYDPSRASSRSGRGSP